ncbi:MAG: EMC3/TMCO1 family protein [Thermoplasmata archaeon]
MPLSEDTPLSSAPDVEADAEEEPETEEVAEPTPSTGPPAPRPATRPPPPTFKFSTFALVFLGMLGLWMLIDATARNSIINLLGTSPTNPGPLYLAIGFGSQHILVTMALAGAIEMLITALAYNWATDWVKAATVQKWSSAFRKVQMEAIRSGKKDRTAALRPHQDRLTRLSSEVSIAQFKGMAITWFLLILIYSWVGVVIGDATVAQQTVFLGGTSVNLMQTIIGPIPVWFVIFSLYTVPLSLIFRRLLKHYWLQRYAEHKGLPIARSTPGATGGSS